MDKKTKRLIGIIKDAKSRYTEDNIVLAIPRVLSKSFTSFCSMREDLLLIKEFIKRLKGETDRAISSALTYSTVSLYGKCFTDATNTKSPKLEPNQIFEEDTKLKSTHDYLMNLRHNFVAHRGDTESEVEVAYLLVPKKEGEPELRYAQTKQMKFGKEEIDGINELIDYLLEIIVEKIQKAGQKTYDAYFKHFTPQEMSFMMLNNVKDDIP